MMQSYRTSAFAVAISLFGSMHYLGAQNRTGTSNPASATQEIRFIAAGIANGRQQFKRAQAVMDYSEYTPKEYLAQIRSVDPKFTRYPNLLKADKDTVSRHRVWWYHQDPKFAMFIKGDPEDAADPIHSQRLVADGTTARILMELSHSGRSDGGVHGMGFVAPEETIVKAGVWQDMSTDISTFDPTSYVYFQGKVPLNDLFLSRDLAPTYRGEELVEGTRCMKVGVTLEVGRRCDYWIDVKHGFLLRH